MSKTVKIWWISVSEIYVFFEYQFASVLVPILKNFKKFWIDSDTIWELRDAQNSSPMPPPRSPHSGSWGTIEPKKAPGRLPRLIWVGFWASKGDFWRCLAFIMGWFNWVLWWFLRIGFHCSSLMIDTGFWDPKVEVLRQFCGFEMNFWNQIGSK